MSDLIMQASFLIIKFMLSNLHCQNYNVYINIYCDFWLIIFILIKKHIDNKLLKWKSGFITQTKFNVNEKKHCLARINFLV